MKAINIVLFFNLLSFHCYAKEIIVGSKIFSESIITAELISIILEEKYSFNVVRKFNLGGTQVNFDAINAGEIDIYPEYTGTAFSVLLKHNDFSSVDELQALIKKEYGNKFNLYWSESIGFNNTYALAMRADDPKFKDISKISDLVGKERLARFAAPHEFMERNDGYLKFIKRYKLKFPEKNIITLNSGLMYSAIHNNKVDLIMSYSTDGRIKNFNLRLLEDDLNFFPPYLAAYTVRKSIVNTYPEVIKAIKHIEHQVSEDEIIHLNNLVDEKKEDPYKVARDFLVSKNIVSKKEIAKKSQYSYLLKITKEHFFLSFVSLFIALVISVPLAIFMTRNDRLANWLFPIINTIQTIPSLALLGFLIPLFGIGFFSALIALFLYALLPLIRNTYSGIKGIDPSYIETAMALGLTEKQILYRVKLPMAMPIILSGVRTATAIIIGTATLAALVGAGGYGDPIFRGIATVNTNLILLGAVPSAIMAILIDKILGKSEKWLISDGLKK